jgi:hypothetical protein
LSDPASIKFILTSITLVPSILQYHFAHLFTALVKIAIDGKERGKQFNNLPYVL